MKTLYNLIPLVSIFIFANALTGCDEDTVETVDVEISLNKDELVLEIGESERLEASFHPEGTQNIAHVWNSSNNRIATVDETGMVTAQNAGEAIITAKTLNGNNTATCNVTVVNKKVPVSGISLDKNECEIAVGNRVKLNATIKPENATNKNVRWQSEDTKIATIDSEGQLYGISEGVVIVNAITEDGGKTAVCKVSVVDKGVKMSLPEILNVTSTSAMVMGTINPVGVTIKSMGICYSTKPNPTINDERVTLTNTSIAQNITALKPETTYYVRFYAVVDDNVTYSDQNVFETLTSVELSAPTFGQITASTAVVSGTIKTNGSDLEESGFVFSTNENPTIADNRVSISKEEFEYTLYELEANTKYYVRLYALVNGQAYYGEENHFVTNEELVTQFAPTDYYYDRLILKTKAPKGYTSVDVCYSTQPNPKVTDNIATATMDENGDLILDLKGLATGTTYYIRPYSRIGAKIEYYENEVSAETFGGAYYMYENQKDDDTRIELIQSSGSNGSSYYFYTYFNYVLPEGTYTVSSPDDDGSHPNCFSTTSDGEYNRLIYISGGTGTFYFKSYAFYNGFYPYIQRKYTEDVELECVETGVVYHCKVYDYLFDFYKYLERLN